MRPLPGGLGVDNDLSRKPDDPAILSATGLSSNPSDVLGLDADQFLSAGESKTSGFRAEGGVPKLSTELMLFVTECEALIVDMELDVSDEIVDSGRGINSSVSEKPTLGRAPPALSRRVLGGEFGAELEVS
jgi:hypothetical protein